MKRIAFIVFLAAFVGSGCLTMPPGTEMPKPVVVPKPVPPPQVFDDQITDDNAAQKCDELRKELDFAADNVPAPPTIIVTKPK